MYEEFFGLRDKPFSIQPDPDYMFWSRGHAMAFGMIEYGVMNRAGFTVITGEIGSGKTTLVRHLLNQLDEETTVGLVSNAFENRGDLLQWVLMAFGQPHEQTSHVALHEQFVEFLIEEYAAGRRTVLIVDEAQNLGPQMLEELRMLSNINADKDQLLQMILLGQPELRDLLQRPELVQFAQRIASDFHLRPLTAPEVHEYIAHRVRLAGGSRKIFTEPACERIAEAAKGIPRLINILCDTALVYGYSEGKPEIDSSIVEKVLRDKAEYGIFSFNASKDDDPDPKLALAAPKRRLYPIE